MGLLAVGGVALTLGLVRGDDDSSRDDSSVSVHSDDHGSDVIDALGDQSGPSAHASATSSGKKQDTAEMPRKAASPTSSGASKEHANPDADSPDSSGKKADTDSTAAATTPGVSVFSHASKRCIDVVGGKAVQGAGLMIWDCNKSASQHWTFTGGTMQTLGMCVQLAGGSAEDGTDLQLASCDGSTVQQFNLNVRSDLVNPLADKCADVRENQTANGTRLQLWSCSGGENQKWSSS
ncbi:ricin-type beta-trefoil lectin domain protein (plasmid) [Streptomyces sp. Q6]|uniref:Ricin-type beta-trefoil lectin domain protein n=1 Tax=Streptomyces citrinus TaxID=3118173 RepID=A0ACD5AVP4_9ACTN